MQKFYKSIKFDNIDLITKKLQKFIQNSSCSLDVTEVLSAVPELKIQLESYGFSTPSKIKILIVGPMRSAGVHDDRPKLLALNWPLVNCGDSVMRWYDNPEIYELGGEQRATKYEKQNAVVLDSIKILEPTLVNIECPHEVENFSSNPRVMMSIRFSTEPTDIFLA